MLFLNIDREGKVSQTNKSIFKKKKRKILTGDLHTSSAGFPLVHFHLNSHLDHHCLFNFLLLIC